MALNVRSGAGRKRKPAVIEHDTVETPSHRIVTAANTVTYLTTEKGVKIGIRQLGAIDEMRLTRAIGADSGNQQFMLWCMMAAAIESIDGDKLPMPANGLECEVVVQRIGDDGIAALQRHGGKVAAERQAAERRNNKRGSITNEETAFVDEVKK